MSRRILSLIVLLIALPRSAALVRAAEPDAPWAFEISLDLSGRTGNREQFGTAAGSKATYKTDRDTLLLSGSIDQQQTNGVKSADNLKLGADYQNNFHERLSWYVRDEAGFDRVKDIDFYNLAGVGIGYDLIKRPVHVLTVRIGVSHRIENMISPGAESTRSLGLDLGLNLGLNHEYQFAIMKVVNRLAYVPDFNDLGDFRFSHESTVEVPLTAALWKLRIGISNEYRGNPGPGLERMDTTYFTRLVLSWG